MVDVVKKPAEDNQSFQEALTALGEAKAALEAKAVSESEYKSKFESIESAIKERLDAEKKLNLELQSEQKKVLELEAKQETLEKLLSRQGGSGTVETKEVAEAREYMAKLNLLAKKGIAASTAEEIKELRTDNDPQGGFLVPTTIHNELLQNVTEISPMRAIASSFPGRKRTEVPAMQTKPVAYWVGEGQPTTESSPTFRKRAITIHKMAVQADATLEDIQDSAFNVEAMLRTTFVEALMALEGTAFVTGASTGRPEGFAVDADVSFIASGSATDVTLASITKITGEIKSAYTNRAVYTMNRRTWAKVLGLLQANGNNETTALFRLGDLRNRIPSMLNGAPVIEMPDMDDTGADTYPIAYGDFRSGYYIFDGADLAFAVDDKSQLGNGKYRYFLFKRTGGGVVLPEAIKLLKCST